MTRLGQINPRGDCAKLYPWHLRNKLVDAARAKNIKVIDEITDILAFQGLARPRNDASMFPPSAMEVE